MKEEIVPLIFYTRRKSWHYLHIRPPKMNRGWFLFAHWLHPTRRMVLTRQMAKEMGIRLL